MIDLSSLPIPVGALFGLILYALFSVGAGQVVAERTISASNWNNVCVKEIRSELTLKQTFKPSIPRPDCQSILGLIPGLSDVCKKHGNPSFNLPIFDRLEKEQNRARELEQKRLDKRAAKAGQQCGCAASVVADDFTSWGLYAASARAFTPTKIQNLNSELITALNTPRCQFNK